MQYKLHLSKFDVDLRKKKYHNAIEPFSQAIYQIITSDQFSKEIDAIRELRDHIVHRSFIQTGTGEFIRSKQRVSLLHIKQDVYNLLLKAGFKTSESLLITNNFVFILFEDFINFIREVIVRVVNSLIKVIAEEKYGANETYIMWELFQFPNKPYVL